MGRRRLERFKNYIMAFLVLTSLIQVGILWNIQNHGFPINFLSAFSSITGTVSQPNEPDAIRKQYFVPKRIVVSEGFDGRYWIAPKGSHEYNELWEGSLYYLGGILDSTIVQGEPQVMTTSTTFPEIFAKSAAIIDFNTGLQKDLLAGFLSVGKSESSAIPLSVDKVIISPLDDVNPGMNTIYLVSKDITYKYSILAKNDRFKKQFILNIIDKYSKATVVREYISAKYAGHPFKTSPELLFSVIGDKFDRIKGIISEPADFLSYEDPDEAAKLILGDEKFSYYNSRGNDDSVEFKNFNNSYRISPEGVLEYRYLQNEKEQSKANIMEAYENAVEFLERIKPLIKGSDLYLSGIQAEDNKQYYEFTFDYSVNGYPVFVESKSDTSNNGSNSAVRIRANSIRVLSCNWLLKDFSPVREKMYNVNHNQLLGSLPKKLGDKYRNNFSIKEISIGYVIRPEKIRRELDAVWRINTLEDIHYIIEMESK